jgi:hypothetical protein
MKNKLVNWYKKYITTEANDAFESNNVKKIQDLKNMGYDVIDLLKFEKHPLLISIKENKIPMIIFFIKNGITESILEEALILSKKEKKEEIEKIIILHTQSKEIKKEFYKKKYIRQKKEDNNIIKNNV